MNSNVVLDQMSHEDRQIVSRIRDDHRFEFSAAFAVAVSQRMALSIVIFFDQNGDPAVVLNEIGNGMYFSSGGPISAIQLWTQTRLPLAPIASTPVNVCRLLKVTDDEIEAADKDLVTLQNIFGSHFYH